MTPDLKKATREELIQYIAELQAEVIELRKWDRRQPGIPVYTGYDLGKDDRTVKLCGGCGNDLMINCDCRF